MTTMFSRPTQLVAASNTMGHCQSQPVAQRRQRSVPGMHRHLQQTKQANIDEDNEPGESVTEVGVLGLIGGLWTGGSRMTTPAPGCRTPTGHRRRCWECMVRKRVRERFERQQLGPRDASPARGGCTRIVGGEAWETPIGPGWLRVPSSRLAAATRGRPNASYPAH